MTKPVWTHSIPPIALAAALLSAGCAARRVQQEPALPRIPASDTWNTSVGSATPADDDALARWWTTLGDPLLASLEERAVQGNLELRKAGQKIRQAQAEWQAARADRSVSATLSSSATGYRTSTRSGGVYSQSYNGTLDASWEPDFFHRIEQTASAYGIDVETAKEDQRSVLVSLTAQVALDYIDLRSYQKQLALTRRNLEWQEQTYELTAAKYDSGLATKLDIEQAAANVESTRASIPTLETGIQKSSNAIAVLLGERPAAVDAELAEVKPIPLVPVDVAVGIPADLVRRRPDIRGAERQVAAQSARVSAATASLYPTFSLSVNFSLKSFNVLNYLTPASLASSLAGSVQQTVFNRRKLHENVNAQNAALDQSVTAYENTLLTALQDVEDALKAFAGEQARRKWLAAAAASAERAAEMARNLYGSGLKDFLTVLDAERSVLSLQNELAQSEASVTANLVRLYKALGGGWR